MLSRCSSHGFWSAANSLLPASRRSRNSATATTCQRSEETSPVPHARGTHHDPSTRHRLRSRCPTRARNSPLGNLDRAGVALATVPGESSVRGSDRCAYRPRSEEHTSELQSRGHLVCRLLLEKKKK